MSSSPASHSLKVSRTARYVTLGAPDRAPTWWVVLHGYGQLAGPFIEHFEPLVSDTVCVIAPEALSRFYVDDMNAHKEVGASWMTRVEREGEIRDYVAYLDAVMEHLQTVPTTLNVLGFSQGAATASRWAAFGETSIDRLILWGGGLPPDLDLDAHAAGFQSLDVTLVLGRQDPYVTGDDLVALEHRLESHDIAPHSITFDGGHHLDPAVLTQLT